MKFIFPPIFWTWLAKELVAVFHFSSGRTDEINIVRVYLTVRLHEIWEESAVDIGTIVRASARAIVTQIARLRKPNVYGMASGRL